MALRMKKWKNSEGIEDFAQLAGRYLILFLYGRYSRMYHKIHFFIDNTWGRESD